MNRDRIRQLLTFDRDAQTSPKRLMLLIAIGLVLLLLLLWSMGGDDTPAPQTIPPAEQLAPAESGPPIAPPAEPMPSASISQLTLHGVTGNGTDGAAIIAVAGSGQRLVRTGRDVLPGIQLIAIAADHVILHDRGNDIRLGFPEANGAGAITTVVQPPASQQRE